MHVRVSLKLINCAVHYEYRDLTVSAILVGSEVKIYEVGVSLNCVYILSDYQDGEEEPRT